MHIRLDISSPVPTFHNCLRKGDISGGYEDTDASDDVVSGGYGDMYTFDGVVFGDYGDMDTSDDVISEGY